jgi:hypothetical protein
VVGLVEMKMLGSMVEACGACGYHERGGECDRSVYGGIVLMSAGDPNSRQSQAIPTYPQANSNVLIDLGLTKA